MSPPYLPHLARTCPSLCFSSVRVLSVSFLFFFNDTATTEIYTLSLHDALPIYLLRGRHAGAEPEPSRDRGSHVTLTRSEEHTSELQSRLHLVCRLLLEKKKNAHAHRSPRSSAILRRDRPAAPRRRSICQRRTRV